MEKFRLSVPIILVIFYTVLMFVASAKVKHGATFQVSENAYLNFQFNYQGYLLLITALALLLTFLLNKEYLTHYFSIGNIAAPAEALQWMGIRKNDNWLQTGLSLSLFISIVTGIFMYLQIRQSEVNWGQLSGALLWIILFSLSNSFAEEMIFRMGIVAPLKGLLSPVYICSISAILFGIPHFAGMPNGIIGAVMAGVLGFVLAKSMQETHGFFWAWLIHFLQDVLIIGGLFLMKK